MNRDELKALFGPKLETVEHDGKTYHVKSLALTQRLKLVAEAKDKTEAEQSVMLVSIALCDEAGKPILGTDDEATQIVDNMPPELTAKLYKAVQTACGITTEAYDDAKKN